MRGLHGDGAKATLFCKEKVGPYPTNMFTCCRIGLPAMRVGIMEAKVAACLHPLDLHWASVSKEEARHRGGQPPLATQWHQAAHRACVTGGGKVVASSWLMDARSSQA